MTRPSRWILAGAAMVSLGLSSLSCGRPPRPPELAHADEVSLAPSVRDAAALAPQAFAHAEQLRRAASQAYEDNQVASATILAERSIAAYQRAIVLARAARAIQQEEAAKRDKESSESALREIQAEQARVEADTASIESMIRVAHDAQPVASPGAASGDREQARFEAARSMAVDARLLCAAASLLGTPVAGLAEAQADVAKLEASLAQRPRAVPIDEALRARARCLALLTIERRASEHRAADVDVVLTEATAVKNLAPRRDDRGIVISLRPEATASSDTARASVAPISAIAVAHPEYPILVVAHTSTRPSAADVDRASAAAGRVAKALTDAGVASTRVRVEAARGALPVIAEPIPPPRPSQNERVEVILVAPTG